MDLGQALIGPLENLGGISEVGGLDRADSAVDVQRAGKVPVEVLPAGGGGRQEFCAGQPEPKSAAAENNPLRQNAPAIAADAGGAAAAGPEAAGNERSIAAAEAGGGVFRKPAEGNFRVMGGQSQQPAAAAAAAAADPLAKSRAQEVMKKLAADREGAAANRAHLLSDAAEEIRRMDADLRAARAEAEEMRRLVHQCERQASEARASADDLGRKVAGAEDAVKEKSRELEEAKAECSGTRERLASAVSKLGAAEKELERLRSISESSASKEESLASELRESQAALGRLQAENERVQHKCAELEAELAAAKRKCEVLEEVESKIKEPYERDRATMEEGMSALEAKFRRLVRALEEAQKGSEAAAAEYERELGRGSSKRAELEEGVERLRGENNQLKELLARAAVEKDELASKIVDIDEANLSALKELRALLLNERQRVLALTDQVDQMKRRETKLASDLSSANDAVESLRQENAKLTSELAALKDIMESRTRELGAATAENAKLTADAAEGASSAAAIRQDIDALRAEIDKLTGERDARAADAGKMEEDMKAKQADLDQAKARAESFEAQVAALQEAAEVAEKRRQELEDVRTKLSALESSAAADKAAWDAARGEQEESLRGKTGECERLTMETEALEGRLRDLADKISKRDELVDRLTAEISVLEEQNCDQARCLTDVQSEMEDYHVELERTKGILSQHEAEIRRLLASEVHAAHQLEQALYAAEAERAAKIAMDAELRAEIARLHQTNESLRGKVLDARSSLENGSRRHGADLTLKARAPVPDPEPAAAGDGAPRSARRLRAELRSASAEAARHRARGEERERDRGSARFGKREGTVMDRLKFVLRGKADARERIRALAKRKSDDAAVRPAAAAAPGSARTLQDEVDELRYELELRDEFVRNQAEDLAWFEKSLDFYKKVLEDNGRDTSVDMDEANTRQSKRR